MKKYYILICTLVMLNVLAYSQGVSCDQADPFCAGGAALIFENTSGVGNAETGPNYGCLVEQPNPAWYFIQIEQSGDLFFTIEQNSTSDFAGTPLDVDFIAWGPYSDTNDCNQLTASNQVPGSWQDGDPPINSTTSQGCSYSENATESFNIIGATTGEIYILLITNFDDQPGFIKMEQTGGGSVGAGSTNCSIVNTVNYCDGDVVSLDGTDSNAVSYIWYQDTVLLAETGPVLNNVVTPSDVYTVEKYNSVGGLIETETFNVVFSAVPIANTVTEYVLCVDSMADGITQFNLSTKDLEVRGAQTDVMVTYHESPEDADAGSSPLTNLFTNTTANSQTIYVRIENNNNSDCYDTTSFDLTVNPFPDVIAVPDLIICEDNTDGLYDFDLESKTVEILNGQDSTIIEVTYHETPGDAQAGTGALVSPYTNTLSNPQLIYVNMTNTDTGCSIATVSFNIEVQESAEAYAPVSDYVICDYLGDNDGIGQFDLTTQDAEILGPTQTTGYNVTYYESIIDAEDGVNQIQTNYENLNGNPLIIYARVENDDTICYETTMLTLQVELRPIFDLENTYVFCVDSPDGVVTTVAPPLIDTGLNIMDYSFVWVETGDPATVLGTNSSFVSSQAGNYEVLVTNLTTGCEETGETQVIQSSPPDVVAIPTTLAFANIHVIEATATGDGEYEFSLDGGPWVTNNPNTNSYTFIDVSLGEHTVFARDINGCGDSSDTALIMDYPLYFTPNGDGINETWNITGISSQIDAEIFIYDRYGKLLKQLSPTGTGWDGTFNNEPLPTSDYWFTVEYREPIDGVKKELKAHFTLKR